MPAIFFHQDLGMVVLSAINGIHNHHTDLTSPKQGLWTRIVVSQELNMGRLMYTVSVGGKQVFAVENLLSKRFHGVKVFCSDPWHPAQPGLVRNITIEGRGGWGVVAIWCR